MAAPAASTGRKSRRVNGLMSKRTSPSSASVVSIRPMNVARPRSRPNRSREPQPRQAVAQDAPQRLLDRELLLAVAVGRAGRVAFAERAGLGRVDLASAEREEGQAAVGGEAGGAEFGLVVESPGRGAEGWVVAAPEDSGDVGREVVGSRVGEDEGLTRVERRGDVAGDEAAAGDR